MGHLVKKPEYIVPKEIVEPNRTTKGEMIVEGADGSLGSDNLKRVLSLAGVKSNNPASPAYTGKVLETTAEVVQRGKRVNLTEDFSSYATVADDSEENVMSYVSQENNYQALPNYTDMDVCPECGEVCICNDDEDICPECGEQDCLCDFSVDNQFNNEDYDGNGEFELELDLPGGKLEIEYEPYEEEEMDSSGIDNTDWMTVVDNDDYKPMSKTPDYDNYLRDEIEERSVSPKDIVITSYLKGYVSRDQASEELEKYTRNPDRILDAADRGQYNHLLESEHEDYTWDELMDMPKDDLLNILFQLDQDLSNDEKQYYEDMSKADLVEVIMGLQNDLSESAKRYDYGHHKRKALKMNIAAYNYRGKANMPTRYTAWHSADNPMYNPMKVQESQEKNELNRLLELSGVKKKK